VGGPASVGPDQGGAGVARSLPDGAGDLCSSRAWLGFQTRVGVASGALLIVAILAGLFWSFVLLVPKGAMGAGVTVHARQQVGAYDTATVSAVEPAKLLGWLERNGFEVAAGSRAAITDYVKRGWVFVVLMLKESDDPDEPMRRPHPVAFTFKTDEPVYPMRLTGVENGECDLELFVFADRWVTCDRLDPVFAREVAVGEEHEAPVLWTGSWRETIEIRHRQLGALVGRAMRLTRLAASLTPAEMREDLSFGWTDRVEEPALYTPKAAFDEALTTGAWVSFLALLPLLLIASRFRKLEPAKGRQRIALA